MAIKTREKYRLENGEVVPGVTTIVGELGWNKNVLIAWANRLGLQGKEARGYVDDKAAIGILAHAFVMAELQGQQPDTKDYTSNQIDLAQNCLASYSEWKAKRKIEPIIMEERLISEQYKYGGTPDFFGRVDDVLTLLDYKTGKSVSYPEFVIQVSAYANLVKEKGHKIEDFRILNIPRTENESFGERILSEKQIEIGFKIFKSCLSIYNLKGFICGE